MSSARDRDIGWLMADSRSKLDTAAMHLADGRYTDSINDSYYAAFYAAKAGLLSIGIKTKSHASVRAGIGLAVDQGYLPEDVASVLPNLLVRRNEAIYRYTRRDWTNVDASDALSVAQSFVTMIEGFG